MSPARIPDGCAHCGEPPTVEEYMPRLWVAICDDCYGGEPAAHGRTRDEAISDWDERQSMAIDAAEAERRDRASIREGGTEDSGERRSEALRMDAEGGAS